MLMEDISFRGRAVSADAIGTLMKNLMRVMPVLRKRIPHFEQTQKTHRIPLSHIQVLHAIDRDGAMSMTALSEKLDIAKPNVSPIVERMVSKGYVLRQKSEIDRRIVMIHLTRQGEMVLSAIESIHYINVGKWASQFSESEISELNGNLEAFVRILG